MNVIVNTNHKVGLFVEIVDGNYHIVNDIREATKFTDEQSDDIHRELQNIRNAFPNEGFVVATLPSIIFGTKPRKIYKSMDGV